MKDIDERVNELENKIIEQEHRLLPIVRNVLNHGFDRGNEDRLKASWSPLISYILRRQALTVLITITSGLTALIACFLAFQANNIVKDQNELLRDQNIKVDQQNYLIEAERRSNLVFLFSNIMDKLDQELKDDYGGNSIRDISPQLIGRISSLSQRLEPYRQFSKTVKPGRLVEVSPERSQLFVNIVESEINEETLSYIFKKSNFDNISITNYSFPEKFDMQNLEISDSEFIQCPIDSIKSSIFKGVTFEQNYFNTDFKECYLDSVRIVNFYQSHFSYTGGKISNSNIDVQSKVSFPSTVTFIECQLDSVRFSGSNAIFTANGVLFKNVFLNEIVPSVRLFNTILLNNSLEELEIYSSKLSNVWMTESQFNKLNQGEKLKMIPIGDSLSTDRYWPELVNPDRYYITVRDSISKEKEATEILNHLLYYDFRFKHRYYLNNNEILKTYINREFPNEISQILLMATERYLNIDYAIWFYVQGRHFNDSEEAYVLFEMLDNIRINNYSFYSELITGSYYRQILKLLKKNASLKEHETNANVVGKYIQLNEIDVDSNIIMNRFDIINNNLPYVRSVESIYFPGFKNRVEDHVILYPTEYDENSGTFISKGFN